MTNNPLAELQRFGQSIWYDNIRRGLITSGELERLIADGVTGVTANPTIFEKAISGSRDYDEALHSLVAEGKDAPGIYESLAIEDIRAAADLLRPVYDRTEGRDGFVSLEVSPTLAHDTEGTITEAHHLFQTIGRPNVMIKVPATRAGVPAIERLTGDGLNINVTLTFSVARYEEVATAYLAGLERRGREGKPVNRVASVASFFVSRVDSLMDKLLQAKIREAKNEKEVRHCEALLGKVAIANAKIAYAKFKAIFSDPRWAALAAKGARVQRPLWASTGTKNPAYGDVYYVEALIGPETVNTIPPATLSAFRDHGKVRATLEEDLPGAQAILRGLAAVGIDLDQVTQELEEEGVEAFARSFSDLFECIEAKRHLLTSGLLERQATVLREEADRVEATIADLERRQAAAKIWKKDPTLWTAEAGAQKTIRQALGWLDVPEMMQEHAAELHEFAREVKQARFRDVLLLGLGGSSLCPDVLRLTFRSARGFPRLHVLDTTDSATIRAVERKIDLLRTLVIVASKSGTTPEILALHQYFFTKIRAKRGARTGDQFVVITDPRTPLEEVARAQSFRRIFRNPPDIGGRYSALSYFGLVPAALIGMDVPRLLDRAERMAHACVSCVPARENPGLWLGAVMGSLALHGRDKVTFICSPEIAAFGYWVEQLIAESTGKEGKGIVPVEGEELAEPSRYGSDRLFVYLRLDRTRGSALDRKVQQLEKQHPVVTIRLQDLYDLGGEFFRWEFATAVAGVVIGVNPFDQPNVQESKDNTMQLLERYKATGTLPEDEPIFSAGNIRLYGDAATASSFTGSASLSTLLQEHLSRIQAGDYVALTAFLQRTGAIEKTLAALRRHIRDRFRVATTLGYGPRFLHSTGQLHKGGGENGVFLQFTAENRSDLPIPGEPYGFGIMMHAQALGDLRALQRRGRRVLRVHFTTDVKGGLAKIQRAITLTRGKE